MFTTTSCVAFVALIGVATANPTPRDAMPSCDSFDSCDSCTSINSECRWSAGECMEGCMIADVSCYGGKNSKCPASEGEPVCMCTQEYAPVCGADGKTYGNACAAGCGGGNTEVAYKGECRTEVCTCTEEYAPVCGADGKTYGNVCAAGCGGGNTEVAYKGECKPVCTCTEEYAPVCGADGKTYGNACAAGCGGGNTEVAYKGECRTEVCMCTMEYAPVCGADGNTYSNACAAAGCGGGNTEVAYKGECKLSKCDNVRCAAPATCEAGQALSRSDDECCASCKDETPDVPVCLCPLMWAPVCTTDGTTHGNACQAKCASDASYEKGACATNRDFSASDVIRVYADGSVGVISATEAAAKVDAVSGSGSASDAAAAEGASFCKIDLDSVTLEEGATSTTQSYEVAVGWSGKGPGDNWCNSCSCNAGGPDGPALMCTEMACDGADPDAVDAVEDIGNPNLMASAASAATASVLVATVVSIAAIVQ